MTKSLRILTLALGLILAFALSACQKAAQTDMSQTSDTTQVSQGYGTQTTTSTQTTPEAQPGDQGAPTTTTTTTRTTTKTHHKESSNAPETKASYAEKHTIEIPTGTTFDVTMITPIDTRTSNAGDHIEATLASPITNGGTVLAEAGAKVSGEVTAIQRASRHKGEDDRASIAMEFNTIETVDGPKRLHATVNNAEGKMIAKSTSTRDKLLIGGGAVAGAIVGKVAGGDTKSTIIGAVGGAAAGTGAVLMAKGHELAIEEGAKVSLRVDQPIAIVER